MNAVFVALSFSSFLAISQMVQAGPGHDQSNWSSEPIHVLTMIAIGSVIVSSLVYKQCIRCRQKIDQKESRHDAQCDQDSR